MGTEMNRRGGPLADEWFGRNLKAAREAKGMSQGDVAVLMKDWGFPRFSQQVLARVEAGPRGTGRSVTIGEAFALGEILGVSAGVLIEPPNLTKARALLSRMSLQLRESRAQIDALSTHQRFISEELGRVIGETKGGELAGELADEIEAAEHVLKGKS